MNAHSHEPLDHNRAFALGVLLNIIIVVGEAVFGLLVGSLALLADAGHNLGDVLGLLLAWGASYLVQRKPTRRRTYGLRRTSILASLLNAVLLLVAVGGISWEAIRRFNEPAPVAGGTIILVAGIGAIVNLLTAMLFVAGRKSDLNIQGAFLHMLADGAVSVGVVIAGIVIWTTGWSWVDPMVSLLVGVVIVISTWGLLRDSIDLALDAVPSNIDPEAVERYLADLPGVESLHDLHIWAMSTTETALTVHLIKPDSTDDDALLERTGTELHDKFGIEHATIQLERRRSPPVCRVPCPPEDADS